MRRDLPSLERATRFLHEELASGPVAAPESKPSPKNAA
jgi:hypothetical protein